MSAANSIVARMGLDLAPLQRGMAEAKKIAENGVYAVASAMDRARAKSAEALAAGTGSHSAGAGGNRAIGDSLDAITGQRGWVMRMTMLSHSLPLAGLAGGAIAIEKMTEAMQHLGEVNADVRRELAKPIDLIVRQGPESVQGALESIAAKRAELEKSLTGAAGYAASAGSIYLDPLAKISNKAFGTQFKTGQLGEAQENLQRVDERRAQFSAALAKSAKEETAARHEATEDGKTALAIYEAEREAKEKIAKIEGNTTFDADAKRALKDQVKQESADKIEAIKRDAAADKIRIASEENITRIRKEGRDVAVREAQENYDRESSINGLMRDPAAVAQSIARVNAAAVVLQLAKEEAAEKAAQMKIAKDIADFQGSADDRHLLKLIEEGAHLQERLKGKLRPDVRKELDGKAAENQQEQNDAMLSSMEKTAALAHSIIDGLQGRGQGAALDAAQKHLAVAQAAREALGSMPGASGQQIADADKEIQKLKNQIAETTDEREKSLRHVESENKELEAKLNHEEDIAAQLRMQATYADQIATAERNGNPQLAAALRQQQAITGELMQQAAAERLRHQVQSSLQDLAATGKGQIGADARKALKLEGQAKAAAKRGDMKRAEELQAEANKIKDRIDPLNDADKSPNRGADKDDFIGGVSKEQQKGEARDSDFFTDAGRKNRGEPGPYLSEPHGSAVDQFPGLTAKAAAQHALEARSHVLTPRAADPTASHAEAAAKILSDQLEELRQIKDHTRDIGKATP